MIRLLFATMLLALSLSLTPAVAAEFNATQKSEIEGYIRDYLLKNPEILREALQELERRDQQAEKLAQVDAIRNNAAELFRSSNDFVAGNPNGKVTMVEFFDYNCGYCKKSMPDIVKLIENDKDLRVVMKEFPILGPGSTFAAQAAIASNKQGKYWQLHQAFYLHEGKLDEAAVLEIAKGLSLDLEKLQADMQSPEIDTIIAQNMRLAEALNIQGTPAFVIDETLIPGAVGYEALKAAVAQVRESGCKIC